ncbi:spindle assembly abnormal protein 6 homolog isoform X3 [Ornithorhynchus anatinus]|uniref:spindle assembly abnormal protein 6 homolog isoform X3 n=1 Tax=Ornithorhynchus anatinus TaxID=9258 RepID=UPI0010A8D795|nr:spindle assembly abnormal protein 6 homolog isoform X3 [Ornithorhynchus anatinus]
MNQLLFRELVPLQVKCKDCEERRESVQVRIELQSVSNPVHKKELVIQLTDDTDPFFLYNLAISEEDFQSLKFQQDLLVDFSAFPQKFIDLLQQCTQEQGKEIPRFLLQLVSPATILEHSPASLNVVQTNQFKYLTHLSLKLLPGNDVEVKKFLAGSLKCMKEEKLLLEQTLKKTEEDLSRQLNYTQQALSEKSRELDKLRNELTTHTSSLTSKHSLELTSEREKALQECQRTKQEVLSLRRENATLDAECHEKEKLINQLQTKVAVLEQEIKDKDQLVLRTKEVFDTMQEQKVALEESAEKKQVQLGKLEATIKSLSTELLKANEIIKKLQGDLKTLVGKLKLKNSVTIQQEKLLAEKEEKLQKEQKELQDVGQSLRNKEQEVCKLREQLEASVQKLEESKQLLKTNENVITWLNKQLNESQLTRKQEILGLSTTPSAHISNNSIRSGISPNHNVLDNRLLYPNSGIGYPASSAFTFQNAFPHATSAKTASHPMSGPKVQFNMQFSKSSASSGDIQPGGITSTARSTDKENGENLGLESKYLKKREDSIPLRGLSQNIFNNSEHLKDSPLAMLQASSKPGALPSAASAYFPGQ